MSLTCVDHYDNGTTSMLDMTDICFVSTAQSSITVYRKLKSSDEDYFVLSVIGENNSVYSTQTYYTTVNSPKSNEEKITNGVVGLTAMVAIDGRKQNKNLTIKLNNGVTEGADSVTYDGNTLKSLNITPEKLSTLRYTKLETNYNVDSLTSEGVYSVYYDAEHGIGTHLGIGWCYIIYVKPYGDGSLSLGNLQCVFSSTGNIFTRLKNPNSESWDPWCVINGDLSSYQKIIDNTLETTSNTVPGAINEILGVVNSLKQRAYTLDFGTDSELAQDSNLLGSITINQILTQNVSALYLSYGSVVRQSVPTSGTISLQIPDGMILIWEIVRATENEPACVGVRFEILTEE